MFANLTFEHPQWLWLLTVIPLLILWAVLSHKKKYSSLLLSSTKAFQGQQSLLAKLRPFLLVLRIAALCFFIVAMARPREVDESTEVKKSEGIDIVMSVDVSASMLAKDLKPNRFEALRQVAKDFVNQRPNDRIGITIFAGESYTKTPITSDKEITLKAIDGIEFNDLIEGGTAIGMGLATSVNKLKESEAESKVIILLTDGVNNSGFIDPVTATELALEYDTKVYTIGIGTNGEALSPVAVRGDGSYVYRQVKVEIDEALLKDIAQQTGGKYFRATDNEKLKSIYDEIDKLETSEVEEFKYYNYDEKFRLLILIGLGLICLEQLLKFTVFRSFV
ncbi:MAG: vWA domain-containing protein [Psychroflexus halocasei]